MKRTILPALLLLAITAAAAWTGWERQLSQAGGFAERVPIETEESSEDASASQLSDGTSDEPPRFVFDTPLSEQPSTGETVSSSAQEPLSEESVIASQETSVIAVPEEEHPTEQEIEQAASGHLRELDALIVRMTSSLDTLVQQAMTDYRMLPDPTNDEQLGALIERYLPSLYALEQDADAEAEVIFENLTDALTAIGAPTTLVAEHRIDYEAAKSAQLGYYKELASAYIRQSAGT